MRRSVISMAALGLMLALFVPSSSARMLEAAGSQPAAQDPKAEEAAAYKAWFDANAAAKASNDYSKAMELAREYLQKYPSGQNVDYIKNKWIPQTRAFLFNKARTEKNINEEIRIAKEVFADDPDNLDYIYLLLLDMRTNELFASPPNYAHAAEISDLSQRAIRLVESGKIPGVITDKNAWKQNVQLGMFYHNLALLEAKNKNTDKALDYYAKAATLDASNPSYFLACGVLHQEKYQTAVQKYQAYPEADKQDIDNKPEVKAALDAANKEADQVIHCWARFLASPDSTKYPTRSQVEKVVTDLYKYRNPDSPDGLPKLVEHYKSGATTPPPQPEKPPAAAKPTGQPVSMPSGGTTSMQSNPTTKGTDNGAATQKGSKPAAKPSPKKRRR